MEKVHAKSQTAVFRLRAEPSLGRRLPLIPWKPWPTAEPSDILGSSIFPTVPPRPRRIFLLAPALCLSLTAALSAAPDDTTGATLESVRKTFRQYCNTCHGGKASLGGFNIDRYPDLDSIHKDPRTWQTVLQNLRSQAMPPPGSPKVPAEERDAAYRDFLSYFGSFSVQADEKTVTHHVEGATFPNWVGTDLVRDYAFADGMLTLSVVRPHGTQHALKWKKISG